MRQSIVPRRELFVPARSGWEGRFAFKHWRYAKSLFQSAVGMSHVAIQKWTEVSNVQLCSFHGMYAFVTVFLSRQREASKASRSGCRPGWAQKGGLAKPFHVHGGHFDVQERLCASPLSTVRPSWQTCSVIAKSLQCFLGLAVGTR